MCSLVGLVILLPLNYTAHDGPSKSSDSMSMDSFTISNVDRGSDRYCVKLCTKNWCAGIKLIAVSTLCLSFIFCTKTEGMSVGPSLGFVFT